MEKKSFFIFTKWIAENFKEFIKDGAENDAYRIIGIKIDEDLKDIQLKIKPSVLGNPFYKSPKTIIEENLIEGFSRTDVKIICYFAYRTESIEYVLKAIKYQDQSDEVIVLSSIKEKVDIELKFREFTKRKDIIKKMNGDDAFRLGVISGMKNILREKLWVEKKKNTNI